MEQDNQNFEETAELRRNNWLAPISILAAGIVIAIAVVYSTGRRAPEQRPTAQVITPEQSPISYGSASADNIKPINDQDHILGNPQAPVKVVEFADTECPFCKRFHPTMHQLIQEYGRSGQVAWVYRHFPLDEIHSKARKEAQALECANELGGNAKFWAYTDRWYEITPSNNNSDLSILPKIAEEAGLDRAQFESCLAGDMLGGKYAKHIEDDKQDAVASGGTGTPYNVVIASNGQKFPITGAQPYAALKEVVEAALKLK